jgi:hypothetical protein
MAWGERDFIHNKTFFRVFALVVAVAMVVLMALPYMLRS